MKFEFLEHAADIKFKSYGTTLDEAFANAVLATASYLSEGNPIKEKDEKHISITGRDYESLLYRLLDELLFLFDTEGFIASKAEIKIKGLALDAKIYGGKSEGEPNHIKAATYYDMYIKQTGVRRWEIQAVLDV